ncbi:hypothetical protein DAT35_23765 [Vitiosangium sp. GDMCC 1.1324]|nr:hypothetical protein DAT35_23765 [Vitiosangium sp. GDMCC 1.1324]
MPLELRITNLLLKDGTAILLNTLSDVSPESFHFMLEAKKGLIATATTTTDGNWKLLRVQESARGTTQIFLAWNQPTKRLEAGETMSIPFRGLFANPQGDRPTVPMMLSWPSLTPARSSAGAVSTEPRPLEDEEYALETYLLLERKTWEGRARVPLRLDVVGPRHVLNVGDKPNTLVLRITNSAPPGSQGEDVTFSFNSSEITKSSHLSVELLAGTVEGRPFALGTSDQLKVINRTMGGFVEASSTVSSSLVRFKLRPTASKVLKPGDYLELTLENLVTHHPNGLTNIDVHFERIDGFQDGSLSCLVEKAPLVFGRDSLSGNVGMGDQAQDARLSVRGGPLHLEGAEIQSKESLTFRANVDKQGEDSAARFFVKDEQQPVMELNASGLLKLRTSSTKHGFRHTDGTVALTTYVKSSTPVGGWIGTHSTHSLHFFTKDSAPQVTLDTNGRLGIGTQTPGAPLDVRGNFLIQNSGKLAIGKASPGAFLDVNGNFFIKGKKPIEFIKLTASNPNSRTATINTTIKVSEWYLAVAGFEASFYPANFNEVNCISEFYATGSPGGNWSVVFSAFNKFMLLTCYAVCFRREICKGIHG